MDPDDQWYAQGSVLGPLLFTLFVSDIPSTVNNFCPLFADDTKIYQGVRLGDLSMVDHRASRNKIVNIMVMREFLIFCVFKCHSGSPITIGNLIW